MYPFPSSFPGVNFVSTERGRVWRWGGTPGSRPGLPPVIRAPICSRTSVDVVHQRGEPGEGHPFNCTLGYSERNVWGLKSCYKHTLISRDVKTHTLTCSFSSVSGSSVFSTSHTPLWRRPLIGTLAASVGVEGMSACHTTARSPQISQEQYENCGEKKRR